MAEGMLYLDEQIAALRRKERKNAFRSIEKGIYTGNTLRHFKELRIFEERLSVMIPDTFDFMPAETAKYKYPSEFRPQVILCDSTEQVNMTFSRLEEKSLSWEDLSHTMLDMQTGLKNVHPSTLFFHNEITRMEENPVPWMDFKSYGMDGTLYNFAFLWLVEGGMLLGMFNCPYRDRQEWKYLFEKVAETVKEPLTGRR